MSEWKLSLVRVYGYASGTLDGDLTLKNADKTLYFTKNFLTVEDALNYIQQNAAEYGLALPFIVAAKAEAPAEAEAEHELGLQPGTPLYEKARQQLHKPIFDFGLAVSRQGKDPLADGVVVPPWNERIMAAGFAKLMPLDGLSDTMVHEAWNAMWTEAVRAYRAGKEAVEDGG